jgi:glycosyltransferase involved in cell wall biosynthesis/SAM-dependent methyltransferase
MAKPFFSVLIDTHNHERFIEQAIVSALEQDVAAGEREIIVVDDGSTDRTPEIVRKFESKVRLIRKANGGQASAFNCGIPECTGQIIAFLDGDDWWAPGKLKTVGHAMSAEPAIGLVGHGIVESIDDGQQRTVALERSLRLRLNSVEMARVFRLRKSFLGTSRMTLRATVARRIVPVPEALVIEADEYLFTMAAALSDILILRQALTYYRLHGGNLYIGAATNGNLSALRRKQRVHEALAEALKRDLASQGVARDAVRNVTEIVAAEGEQMRLMLDGGAPWETVRTEKKIYEVLHGDAPLRHRMFRNATMLVAGVLPPKWFYRGRRWVGSRRWYGALRKRALPVPAMTSVARHQDEGQRALKQKLVSFWNSQQVYWDGISTEAAAASPQRERAAAFLPDGARVLDVACGSAANAPLITPRCRYFGSDISQTGLLRSNTPALPLVCGDADQLPFAGESFDATISTFALEHCVNPVRTLHEMQRVVRPGGRIVLLGPSWDLPFWFPNAARSKLQRPGWRMIYARKRLFGQLRGWLFGRLPFLQIEDPDAFHGPFEYDSDAVYVVWSYEVIRQMKRFGCRLVHAEVDDRMWGTRGLVRLFKRALYLLPLYRYAGGTMLLVFER